MSTNTTTETTAAVETNPAVVAEVMTSDTKKGGKKASKKATAPVIASKSAKGEVQYEEGILTLKIDDVEVPTSGNLTRPEGVAADDNEFKAFAESFRTLGQQTPVSVQRTTGEFAPYRLAAGFRRMAALKSIGAKTVQVRVLVDSSDEMRIIANVTENENGKKDISALGRLAGYAALQEKGYSTQEIATMVNKAEDYVRDILRIPNAVEEIRTALTLPEGAEGSTTWAVARLLMRFPKGEQASLLKKVGHLSVAKAREVLADYRAAKNGVERDDDEGEGEGESKGSKVEREEDAVYPEARVIKATVPFFGVLTDGIAAVRMAHQNMDSAAIEKGLNAMARAISKQETSLRALLGDKVFQKAMKDAEKAAKES